MFCDDEAVAMAKEEKMEDKVHANANANACAKPTSTSNSPDIIAAALEVILNDIGSLEGNSADCDPAMAFTPSSPRNC